MQAEKDDEEYEKEGDEEEEQAEERPQANARQSCRYPSKAQEYVVAIRNIVQAV